MNGGIVAVKLITWAMFGVATYHLAKSKNRSPWGWVASATLLFPLVTLLVLAFMRKLPPKE